VLDSALGFPLKRVHSETCRRKRRAADGGRFETKRQSPPGQLHRNGQYVISGITVVRLFYLVRHPLGKAGLVYRLSKVIDLTFF
jgi:hypothetical protein